MKTVYPEEKGKITIQGHKMEWVLRRSKGASAFGIRGSRIFMLDIFRDGQKTLGYGRGRDLSIKPDKEDEETEMCLSYLIDKFGREKRKEKIRENGSEE